MPSSSWWQDLLVEPTAAVDLGSPVLDVVPAVRGSLLQALARLEQPVTRRQLAAVAGVAPGNARVRERLSEWPDLRAAWLFGSVARGDAESDSDVDLLIVADDLEAADLHERLSQLYARALDRKTQAGYESVDVRAADAASCVRWAEQLLAAAEARLEA